MKLFDTKIVAISNQKGGVGKTTSAVNIAAYLAVTETPTLLIDMDPQANATTGVGIDVGTYKKSIYDVILYNNWYYSKEYKKIQLNINVIANFFYVSNS